MRLINQQAVHSMAESGVMRVIILNTAHTRTGLGAMWLLNQNAVHGRAGILVYQGRVSGSNLRTSTSGVLF